MCVINLFRKRMLYRSALLVSSGLTALSSYATMAAAQTTVHPEKATAEAQVEEVVVTARKRQETLINVPASVTALQSDQLKRANATDLSSLSSLVPQLVIATAPSGNGGAIYLRGLGASGSDAGLESEVLIDVDGVPISRGWITNAAFFDVQQIQVLKGPQALFFGKNSPGGVVAISSKGPGDAFAANIDTGYEFNAEERYVEAGLSVPLTHTLAARLAFRYDQIAGWLYNDARPIANPYEPLYPSPGATTNKRLPDGLTYEGRATIDWKPTEAFSAEFKMLVDEHSNHSGWTNQAENVHCAPGNAHPTVLGGVESPTGAQDPYAGCRVGTHTALSAIPVVLAQHYSKMTSVNPFADVSNKLATLKLEYDAGPIDITSVTGYYNLYANGSGNYDESSYDQVPSVVGESLKQWTQEIRALSKFNEPLNFALGLFYEHGEEEDWNIARLPFFGLPILPDPTTGLNEEYYSDNFQSSQTISPYFQGIWKILPNLEVDAGARFTHESKNAQLGNKFLNQCCQFPIAPGVTVPLASLIFRPAGDYLNGTFSDNNWSPDVTLTWHPSHNQTLYAAYRTGYKSGGFSITGVVTNTATIGSLTYKSETSNGFEVGYKAELLNRRLSLDLNAYRYNYGNLQRDILNPTTVTFLIQNAAAARIEGVEAKAQFAVTSDFGLWTDATYNNAKYTSYANAPCYAGQTLAQGCVGPNYSSGVQDLTGDTLYLAPKWDIDTGFTFQHQIAGAWKVALDADVEYNSGYATSDLHNPIDIQHKYYRLNADIRVFDSKHWTFALVGRDINDALVVLGASSAVLGLPGDETGTIARPLQVTLEAGYRF